MMQGARVFPAALVAVLRQHTRKLMHEASLVDPLPTDSIQDAGAIQDAGVVS